MIAEIELAEKIDPARIFGALWQRRGAVFLDSAAQAYGSGARSFISFEPVDLLSTFLPEDRPFELLEKTLSERKISGESSFSPFVGGLIGYLSYDLGRSVEKIPSRAHNDLNLPELFLGWYDWVLVVDTASGASRVISIRPENTKKHAEERAREISKIWREIQNAPDNFSNEKTGDAISHRSSAALNSPLFDKRGGAPDKERRGVSHRSHDEKEGHAIVSNFTCEHYQQVIQKTIDYIYAGDIFQANISQRFRAPWNSDAWTLYRRLRAASSTPYAAFLNCGNFTVSSGSPECFLRVRGRHAVTKPIKGTRPRGETTAEDEALARELLASEKDLAELAMIVDLERNDLGKSCEIGSVRVEAAHDLETYPTVFHLVATVSGTLRSDKSLTELIRGMFPGGSITGAPKIRAMEIIEELEPTRRGLYTGAIGYISANGNADLNIAIRSCVLKDGWAYYQAGGGITAGSDPHAEYEETLHKARAFFNAIG